MTNTVPLSSNSTGSARVYLPSLDGLRLVAFFAVLLNHVAPPASMTWMYVMHERGWIGVELFFVISAFLFFTLFQIELRREGHINVVNFFVRRLLRIYPLMVGAPLLFMLVMYGSLSNVGAAWKQLLSLALFVDNILWLPIFSRGIPFAEHLWTLSFEFQIYLVLPVVFRLCTRLGRAKTPWFLFGIWIVCLAWRATYAIQFAPHPTIYFAPWLRPDSILLGMALAICVIRIEGRTWHAGLLLVMCAIAYVNIPNVNVPGPSNIILYPVTAVMCGTLVWLSLNGSWFSRVLSTRPMVYLGKRSFGMYVFHAVAIAVARNCVAPYAEALTGVGVYWVVLIFGTVLTIAMAIFSYRFIESPFLRLKDARAAVLTRPI